MSNLIRRQDAINTALEFFVEFLGGVFHEDDQKILMKRMNELPSAEPEMKWIPVTERVPKKERKSYWVCTDTKHQCECRWTNNIYGIGESNDWGWKIFDIPQYTKVVAWMPLPEPWGSE